MSNAIYFRSLKFIDIDTIIIVVVIIVNGHSMNKLQNGIILTIYVT